MEPLPASSSGRTHAVSVGVAQMGFDWSIESGQQWYLPEEECSDWGAI